MACNNDHMKPTAREIQDKRAAELIVFACKSFGVPMPEGAEDAAKHIYGDVMQIEDRGAFLCDMIREVRESSPELFKRVVYDARNPMSRKLADWWEKHLEQDAKRERKEKNERKKERIDLIIKKVSADIDLGWKQKWVLEKMIDSEDFHAAWTQEILTAGKKVLEQIGEGQ